MKKLALLTLLAISTITVKAQLPESFDVKCITNNASPAATGWWRVYNPPSTPPVGGEGAWRCTSAGGKPIGASTTPGVYCTGFYSGAHHLDTSYLIADAFYLSSSQYPPGTHVYLQFDSKKVSPTTGGRMAVVQTEDSAFVASTIDTALDLTFLQRESAEWESTEIDLTDSIDKGVFYYAFRFTSSNSASLAWYVDNVRLHTHHLGVNEIEQQEMPISIVGWSSSSKIELSYMARSAGVYNIMVYDMMGRIAYNGKIDAKTGTATYTIEGLNLHPGMYCVKMGNENAYGTAKLIIE